MPRLLSLASLFPLLATLVLAGQPPMPKDPPPKKLTAEEKKELEARWKAANAAGEKASQGGKMDDAVRAYEDVVRYARRLYNTADFPDGHQKLAASLNDLASVYDSLGRAADAEPLCMDVLAMTRRLFKGDHADIAASLNNLASVYRSLGRAADAEPLLKDALAMTRRLHKDRDHPDVATSLSNLGTLYDSLGRPADAEPLCKDALAMSRRLFKGDHEDVAAGLNNLASVYDSLGRAAEAEPLYRDALAMTRRLVKGDHEDVAASLNNLGFLYSSLGKPADAEPLLKDALAMLRRLHKGDHPDVANSQCSLGALYDSLGRPADAEPLLKDALAMLRRLHKGRDHPHVIRGLNNLGTVYDSLGRLDDAEPLFKDALAMSRRVHKGDHPDVANCLSNLGTHYDSLGRPADAEPLHRDALATQKRMLATVAVAQSEQDQIGSRTSLRHYLDAWLSVGGRLQTDPRYAEVLTWKGSVFARQAQLRAAMLGGNDPALAKLFAERNDVARRFANLTTAIPPADRLAEHGKVAKELAGRKDEIDRELSRKSEPFRKAKETAALTPDQLAQALPADAALVDYLQYTHSTPDPDKKGQRKTERRLLAFVARNGKPVVEVELKASQPIEEAVAAWRQAIERGATIGGKDDPAAALRKLVWEPMAKHLGDAKTVLISPDGALGRLPFAALPGADPKKYLIEEIAVAVVPVPQLIPEMLSAKPDTAAKPSLLVVGGVDFDADAGVPTAGTEARAAVRGKSAGKWGALTGTADEAKAVANAFARQFPDGKTANLTGTGATEAAIRDGITGRRVLHFATHGFFAPPPPEPKQPAGLRLETFDRNRAVGVHPGLQCGLVLAGANKPPKAGADDGILTALEVAGLDLRGVELAVLSACETGLGKDAGGEGVLGLQRAFQAAGAGRVVSSLWKVPDQATAALMGRFYHHLWADKQPAAEALRRAQLELLRNPDKVAGWAKQFRGATADDKVEAADDGRLPPRAWAAFTLSGDWR